MKNDSSRYLAAAFSGLSVVTKHGRLRGCLYLLDALLCLAVATSSTLAASPESSLGWRALNWRLASEFLSLESDLMALPADGSAAATLADVLSQNGKRWFDRDGKHWDSITSAVATPDGRLAFTYLREGRRFGYAVGKVSESAGRTIYAGRWFQQSKLDNRLFQAMAADADWDAFLRDDVRYYDVGAFSYVFSVNGTHVQSLGGMGMCFQDKRSNLNWIGF